MHAPIVLFVYNRPEHTRQTLLSLGKNILANESKLFIFSDGFKNNDEDSYRKVLEVRKVIREQRWCKEVIINESSKNKGLAESIILGVTDILDNYSRIIVLEDDLILSKYFLLYMNGALEKYEDVPIVKQISGYSYPMPKTNNNGSYFLPFVNSWGWATWKRVWENIDFECKDYSILKRDKELSYHFNLCGTYDYTKMFIRQMESIGRINSWAIRFYWSVFKQKGIILYPGDSLVKNIGWDGSGYHQQSYDVFPIKSWDENYFVKEFPEETQVNIIEYLAVQKFIKSQTSFKKKVNGKLNLFIKKIKRVLKIY